MGSTIYSQKLKHPVYISYTCEHCGQYNTFSQEIVGQGSAEVRFGTGNKRTQEKLSKIGPQAERNLDHNVARIKSNIARGSFLWLKVHKCTKCHYPQSWQKGRLIRNLINYIIFDLLVLFIFFVWFVDASSADKVSLSAFITYGLVSAIVAAPIVTFILNFTKIEKIKKQKPDIII